MHIQQIAGQAVNASKDKSNSGRNELRKLVRQLVNDNAVTPSHLKADFNQRTNTTLTKVIDAVVRPVLMDIIARACEGNVDTALHRIIEAWNDDNQCHDSPRGASYGKARGWHLTCLGEQDLLAKLEELADGYTVSSPEIWLGMENDGFTGIQVAQIFHNVCELVLETTRNDPETAYIDKHHVMVNMANGNLAHPLKEGVVLVETDDAKVDYDSLEGKQQEVVERLCQEMMSKLTEKSAKPAVKKAEPKAIDPTLAPAIDNLLQGATSGEHTSISVLIERAAQVPDLEEEVKKLQAAASQPRFQSSGESEVDGDTLTYEVVMRKASDIFLDPRGRKSKKLEFDIPTLVWKDADGNEVRHPDCPPVDETYQFRMYMLIKYLSAVVMGENVWLHGHTGTGKTTFIEQVASRVGFPVDRLNLDSNLERADVVGGQTIEVENGSPVTKYVEGILPRAMQKPYWFIMDECDAGRADMLFVVQRALEGKGLTITEDAGRTVHQHELFRFVATANSRGQGDEFGFYAGVRPMNIAFLNRFGMFVEVPYLDKDDEVRLLEKAYPSLTDVERSEFAEFARKVRAAFLNGEITQTMSPRNLHAMAKYYLHFKSLMSDKDAKKEAVAVAIIDAAPADNRHTIERLFENLTA
jgi:cobaltochelatase CobS